MTLFLKMSFSSSCCYYDVISDFDSLSCASCCDESLCYMVGQL